MEKYVLRLVAVEDGEDLFEIDEWPLPVKTGRHVIENMMIADHRGPRSIALVVEVEPV